MTDEGYDLGMVGLGVMGRNLLLNMAEKGFALAGYDLDASKVQALNEASGEQRMFAAKNLEAFIAALRRPRAVMMLVPAGPPVDSVINNLLPYLERGDLIIDGGNSHYPDTELRAGMLKDRGIDYLGVGISGGEEGARRGPSMMPGGPREAYRRVQNIFEAAAAKVNGEPCVAYLGPGSAGHYVKMVHNGIEYGFMQLIAESYHLMKRALGMDDDHLHAVFSHWNEGELSSYLIEITADIFCEPDEKSAKRLIDVIEDVARQKGTGRWTAQDAMDLQVPVPNIDLAVTMRNLSSFEDQRAAVNRALGGDYSVYQGDRTSFPGAAAGSALRRHDLNLYARHGPAAHRFRGKRVSPGPGDRRPYLAGRLHYPGRPAGGDSRRLPGSTRLAQPAA